MTLLNATALATALGVIVPIVIHLHRRRRATIVLWSAMQFLTQSQASRRRGLALENLLLLFVRCCVVLLFALAVARPLLPEGGVSRPVLFFLLLTAGVLGLCAACVRSLSGWVRIAGAAAAAVMLPASALQLNATADSLADPAASCDLVIVLDETSTMQMEHDGVRPFDGAVAEAQRLIDRLFGRSTVSIVRCGPVVETVEGSPFQNLNAARNALGELEPSGGGADMAAAMDRALLLAAKGTNSSRQIVLFTDNQQLNWESVEASTLLNPHQTDRPDLADDQADPQRVGVAVHLTRLPPQPQNVSVNNVRIDALVLTVGQSVMVTADITNHSDQVMEGISSQLEIDGLSVATKSLPPLAPATTTTVRFPFDPAAAGERVITVRLTSGDALPDDDHSHAVVTVRPCLSVLLVNGNMAARPGEQAALLMSLALDPTGQKMQAGDDPAPRADRNRPVQVNPVAATQLAEQTPFEDYDIVLLCEVPQLPQRVAGRIADYVKQGGSLWVLPDAQANTRFYNSWTVSDAEQALLPAILRDQRQTSPARSEKEAPQGLDLTATSSIVEHLLQTGEHDLSDVEFASWRRVHVSPTAVVGMKLTGGDPLFVEQTVELGRVLLQTAGPAQHSGNLLHRVSFPVMMHLWASHLASASQDASEFAAAAELAVPLKAVIAAQANAGPASLQLTDPADRSHAIPVVQDGQRQLAVIRSARKSGVYQLRRRDAPAVGQAFVVTRDPAESELQVASSEKLSALAAACDLQWIKAADDVRFAGTTEGLQREIAPLLLACVMCLLAMESLVACWVRRRRSCSPRLESTAATRQPVSIPALSTPITSTETPLAATRLTTTASPADYRPQKRRPAERSTTVNTNSTALAALPHEVKSVRPHRTMRGGEN